MKNNKSVAYILIALCVVLVACTNGSFDVVKYVGGSNEGGSDDEPIVLSSIAATSVPSVPLYFVGDEFDSPVLTVTATYSDGSRKLVTGWSASEISTESISIEQKIVVSYNQDSGSSILCSCRRRTANRNTESTVWLHRNPGWRNLLCLRRFPPDCCTT